MRVGVRVCVLLCTGEHARGVEARDDGGGGGANGSRRSVKSRSAKPYMSLSISMSES